MLLVLKPEIGISVRKRIIIIIIIVDVCVSELVNIVAYFVFLDITNTCNFGLQNHSDFLLTESNILWDMIKYKEYSST